MTLYELTGQYLELLEMAEEEDIDPKTLSDTLDGIDGEIEEKAENYAKVLRSISGEITSIQAEIDRLAARKSVMENNVKKIKTSLQEAMIATGKRKFSTNIFSFYIQKNPASVSVKDAAKVPKKFFKKLEPVLDKMALKEFLAENGPQKYAELVQTESLRIR